MEQTTYAPYKKYTTRLLGPEPGTVIRFKYDELYSRKFKVIDRNDEGIVTLMEVDIKNNPAVLPEGYWYQENHQVYNDDITARYWPEMGIGESGTVKVLDYEGSNLEYQCGAYYRNLPMILKNSIIPTNIKISLWRICTPGRITEYEDPRNYGLVISSRRSAPNKYQFGWKIGEYTVSNQLVYPASVDDIRKAVGT